VCAADDPGGRAVVRLLPRLVDKSLVSTVGRGPRRYRLLETIRTYAAERLAASGSELVIRRRHAAHYLALAGQAAGRLRSPDQRAWLHRLITEQPNLRAALAHSITTGDMESAWRLVAMLQRFWDITGQRREAQGWIQQALAISDPPATPAAAAGLAAASTILQPSDSQAAFGLAQRAAQLAAGARVGQRAHAARPATRRGASPVAGTGAGHRSLRRRLRRGQATAPGSGAAARLVRPL
jgi:hypothetical protein